MINIVEQINFSIDEQTEKNMIEALRTSGCIFAEEETRLLISEASTLWELRKMVEKRAEGFPLEQVIGYSAFCGLRIEIDSDVFIPRKRTEFLVRQAVSLTRKGDTAVDLCCGSGAVGAALAAAINGVVLYSADIDSAAVSCARRNTAAFIGRVYQGDLYHALPRSLKGRVNILAANTPYVPSDKISLLPREARFYEPRHALDGGKDGLELQRRVVKEALNWLAPGGHLLVETSERQSSRTFAIFSKEGLHAKIARDDEWDATVVIGKNPNH